MRETMASVLGRSFFITREMDRQFRASYGWIRGRFCICWLDANNRLAPLRAAG